MKNNPNIEELRLYLEKKLDYISTTAENFEGSSSEDQFSVLLGLSEMVSDMIQNVRNFSECERKKLQKFLTGNYPNKPDKAISSCKTNIYTSTNWMKQTLDINNKLFQYMSTLQKNLHLHRIGKEVNIEDCVNVRILNEADYVCSHLDKEEYPHLIKKYSEEWNDFVRQSIMTHDTIGDALGINGYNALKKHHNLFIMENFPHEMFQKNCMEQYEIDAIATITTVFMPALMPSCAIFYEEGSSFIKGSHQPKLINCSPCGVIR